MTNANEIIDILKDHLNFIYCYNCRFYNVSMYDYKSQTGNIEHPCLRCHRDNMMWTLSKETARDIAYKIMEAIEDEA